MLRSVGKQRVRRVDRDVLTRDAYCYFLGTTKGMSATEIAKVVFPDEKRSAAIGKIRKILSLFRKRLKSAGLSDKRET